MELKSIVHMMKNFATPSTNTTDTMKKHTIICLHGYLSNGSVFTDFKNQFQDKFNIKFIELPTLQLNVENLAVLVDNFLIKHNIIDFSLIGHSLGSIVSMYHQLFIAKKKAKSIICVASPLFGSSLHKFMYGPNNVDLYMHSDVLNKIRNELYKIKKKIIFIQASNDMLINKFDLRGLFQDRMYKIECGHVGILIHPMFFNICKTIFI
jgi:hypothetical protein